MDALYNFVGNVVALIIQPLIGLLFALALFMLVWGASAFILKSGDPKARETGRAHLLWGVIGMFIMVAVFAILSVITNTFCGTPFCR